jgi:hypothetical protein
MEVYRRLDAPPALRGQHSRARGLVRLPEFRAPKRAATHRAPSANQRRALKGMVEDLRRDREHGAIDCSGSGYGKRSSRTPIGRIASGC